MIRDRINIENGTEVKGLLCVRCDHYYLELPGKDLFCEQCFWEMKEMCKRMLEDLGLDREKVRRWRTERRV